MSTAFELLQWAAILVLAVMVFGLTRQLGFFLVPRHEQLKQQGPAIGSRLGVPLLPTDAQAALRTAMAEFDAAGCAVLVIEETCSTCQQVLRDLESLGSRERLMPLVAIVKRPGSAFLARVHASFDVVIPDPSGEVVLGAGMVTTPYLLMTDHQFRVEEVEIGSVIADIVPAWFAAEAGMADPLRVFHVDGRVIAGNNQRGASA